MNVELTGLYFALLQDTESSFALWIGNKAKAHINNQTEKQKHMQTCKHACGAGESSQAYKNLAHMKLVTGKKCFRADRDDWHEEYLDT